MITLTYEKIRNRSFAMACAKLSNHTGFRPATALRVSSLLKQVQKFKTELDTQHDKIVMKYADKDEKGNLKAPEGAPPGSFSVPTENQEKFQSEMEELNQVSREFQNGKLTVEQLDGMKLTPAEIAAIEDFISELKPVAEVPELKPAPATTPKPAS